MGSANLTYTNEDRDSSSSNTTGNPFGSASDVKFNGSGDVNGMTVSFFAGIDAGGGSYASNSFSVDMGDMGKIKFDQGVGGNGIGQSMTNLQLHGKNHGMVSLVVMV